MKPNGALLPPRRSPSLPLVAPPLVREHRLYQADWLLRFYGFEASEIVAPAQGGMLALDVDPKLAWALAHRERLLRTPGLGVRSVDRLIALRRLKRITLEDVRRLSRGLSKLKPFIVTADWRPGALTDRADLREHLAPAPKQLDLF